jgi:hypothetical protein
VTEKKSNTIFLVLGAHGMIEAWYAAQQIKKGSEFGAEGNGSRELHWRRGCGSITGFWEIVLHAFGRDTFFPALMGYRFDHKSPP